MNSLYCDAFMGRLENEEAELVLWGEKGQCGTKRFPDGNLEYVGEAWHRVYCRFFAQGRAKYSENHTTKRSNGQIKSRL